MAGPIRIAILANASQAKRELNDVSRETSTLGSKLGKFGRAAGMAAVAGLAVAGAAAVKFGADSVKAASDAQQSLGATETVFGRFSKTVVRTSEEAATKYGLSANVYRENANLLGSLFKNQGVSMDQLGGKTEKMIGTAADLAATFGGTTTDAVEALGAAFKGEYDQLEKYGISIKQSDVNARLAAQGQDHLTGAALKAAEQQAKSALIAEQAAQANGAFARESDTLAHQQQVLGAQFENVKAKVGAALLPVLTSLLKTVNEKLLPAFQAIGEFLRPVVERVKEFFNGLGGGQSVIQPVIDFIQGKFLPAIQGIVTAFQGYLEVVVPIYQEIFNALKRNWDKIAPYVKQVFNAIKTIITGVLKIIQRVIELVTSAIRKVWDKWGKDILRFVTRAFESIAQVVGGVMKAIAGVVKTILAVLKGDWKGAWEGIKQILSGVWQAIKGIVRLGVDTIKGVMKAAWAVIKEAAKAVWEGIKGAFRAGIDKVVGLARGIKDKILGAVSGAARWLWNTGKDIVGGLIDGIKSLGGAVVDALLGLIPGPLKKFAHKLGINSPSKVFRNFGENIGEGLAFGIKDSAGLVIRAASGLTAAVESGFTAPRLSMDSASQVTAHGATAQPVRVSAADDRAVEEQTRLLRAAADQQLAELRALVGEIQDVKQAVKRLPREQEKSRRKRG